MFDKSKCSIGRGHMNGKEVAEWLWNANPKEVHEVWLTLLGSSKLHHGDLNDAIFNLHRYKELTKAKALLKALQEAGYTDVEAMIAESGLLEMQRAAIATTPSAPMDMAELRERNEYLEAVLALKDEGLQTSLHSLAFDDHVWRRRVEEALHATPERLKGYVHNLKRNLEESRMESHSFYTAYERLKAESSIIRNALWHKINRLERAFLKANHQRKSWRNLVQHPSDVSRDRSV